MKTSLAHFKMADNGGTTLEQIANYYLGTAGDAILAVLATTTCMTSAMGLVVAFSQDFHRRFPKISYKAFLRFNCGLSFLVANLGLDQIIAWSTPILMFLYPLPPARRTIRDAELLPVCLKPAIAACSC